MEKFPLAKFANQGFTGVDASLAISLFEYGLAWRPLEGDLDNFQFIVGVRHDDQGFSEFDCTTLHRDDFADMLKSGWTKGFLAFADIKNVQAAVDAFPAVILSVIAYFGTEAVFGTVYETFGITEEEV